MQSTLLFQSPPFDNINTEYLILSKSQETTHEIILKLLSQDISVEDETKKYILQNIINDFMDVRDKCRPLEEKFNSLIEQKKDFNSRLDTTSILVEVKADIQKQIEEYAVPDFDRIKIDELKLKKITDRINTLLPKLQSPKYLQAITQKKQSIRNSWGTPIFTLALIQALFFSIFLFINFDIRVVILGVLSLLVQVVLALWLNQFEVNSIDIIEELQFAHPEIDQEDLQLGDLEDRQLLQFAVYESLLKEQARVNNEINELLGGRTLEENNNLGAELDSQIHDINNRLTLLEGQTIDGEKFLQLNSELERYTPPVSPADQMKEEKETTLIKIILQQPLVIHHTNSPSRAFVEKQYNLLTQIIDGVVIYMSDGQADSSPQQTPA